METMENHGMDAEFNFESALEDYLSTDFGDLEEGTIVKGEIVRVDDDNVLVDVNFKSEGQIPTAEFRDAEGNLVVKVGDRVDVFVARKNEQEGTITLSFEKAKRMQLFDQLEDVQEKNGVIKGRITASRAVTLWIWAAWKRSSPVPMWTCAPCRTWTLW